MGTPPTNKNRHQGGTHLPPTPAVHPAHPWRQRETILSRRHLWRRTVHYTRRAPILFSPTLFHPLSLSLSSPLSFRLPCRCMRARQRDTRGLPRTPSSHTHAAPGGAAALRSTHLGHKNWAPRPHATPADNSLNRPLRVPRTSLSPPSRTRLRVPLSPMRRLATQLRRGWRCSWCARAGEWGGGGGDTSGASTRTTHAHVPP